MKRNAIFIFTMLMVFTLTFAGCGSNGTSVDANAPSVATVPVEGDQITPSDYWSKDNWMFAPKSPSKPVDVFYLYPTVWGMANKTDFPVCDIAHKGMRRGALAVAEKNVSAFEEAGNIYAPYYRQVDASWVLSKPLDAQPQFFNGIPKSDAMAAFAYYIEHYNGGRPFILVGHSQGSVMTKELLFDYMKDHPKVYERMVAAYVIGYSVTQQELDEHPYLTFAERADDTGVIISYNTEAPEIDGVNNTLLPGSMAINPISWSRSGEPASAEQNLGSRVQVKGRYQTVMGLADATVDLERGTVICSTVNPDDYYNPKKSKIFPRGVYHSQDYTFYYYNLKENAQVRVASYLLANQ